jgi:hypothetical protein
MAGLLGISITLALLLFVFMDETSKKIRALDLRITKLEEDLKIVRLSFVYMDETPGRPSWTHRY